MRPFFSRIIPFLFLLLLTAPATAQVTGLSGWNLYLDPGHSGIENMGVLGYSEAEKNLRVALELRDLLLENTDIDTVYTSRTSDLEVVGLSQRSDDANRLGAAWFHSIHSDAAGPTANSTLMLWGQYLSGAEKVPNGGKAMSDIMTELLSAGMRIPQRGSIGDCSFYRSFIANACSSGGPYLSVNRQTTMPAELSEAGFHTNPTQNQRNMNADWKRMEAKTFYWSVLQFHNQPRPAERIVTGIISDTETGLPINGATVTFSGETYTTDTYDSLFKQYSNDPNELRNGFYYLEALPPGAATLRVEAEGYDAFQEVIAPIDTFFTFFDVQLVSNVPPRVITTTPAADTPNFRIIDDLIIDFNRVMERATVEAAFALSPSVDGTFRWSNNDFRLTFAPDSLMPETDYTLSIAGTATGAFGDALDGNGDGTPGDAFTLAFRTGNRDVLAPALTATSPSPNSQGVNRDPILTLVYNEEINPASLTPDRIVLETTTGTPVAGQAVVYTVGRQSLVTFFPSETLAADTYHRLVVNPGLEDLLGNAETGTKQILFRTGTTLYDVTPLDAFEGDLNDWWEPQQSGSTAGIVTDSTGRTLDGGVVNLLTGSTGAMRVDYGWDTGETTWLVREYLGDGAPRSVLFDSTYALEVYLFGDGSGNRFRFAVDDNVGNSNTSHEVSPWYTVDWLGWRLVSWRPARDGVGSWIGNGVADGTLRFDSIQLSYTPGAEPFGRFYFDDLRLTQVATFTATEPTAGVPQRFHLHQNYPNPFNPTTTLRFDLPAAAEVTLKIFNVLGAEVATLAEQKAYAAGTHELTWDATGLPSGVYLARISGERSKTIRMVLLK